MILDTIDNAHKYLALHPRFAKAFEFIQQQNLQTIEAGKFEIEGTDIHASVSLKQGVTKEEAKFEAHNNHIDIQVCPSGSETLDGSLVQNAL
jgi:YhcH/YjgK/YiaL family protein